MYRKYNTYKFIQRKTPILFNKNIRNNNISVLVQGRLGNQLFEIISCWSYAKKHNKNFVLPKKYQKDNSKYYNIFFKNINYVDSVDNYFMLKYEVFQDISNIVNIPDVPILINSYLQNSNNFKEYRNEILKLFFGIDELRPKNNKFFIHIRLTDFMHSPEHNINLDNYYIKAINYISNIIDMNNTIFYIVSDDINNARKKTYLSLIKNENNNIIYIDNEEYDEIKTMELFKDCSGAIIGHSTFAWWGAYIMNCLDKIVVCPNKFLNKNYDFSGMYMDYKVIEI